MKDLINAEKVGFEKILKETKANDPCICGRPVKYKKCCRANVERAIRNHGKAEVLRSLKAEAERVAKE